MTWRNLHLLLGLFVSSFVLMYAFSSLQMSHNSWFDGKPAVTESQVKLATGLEARSVARLLMEQGLRGDIAQVQGTRFRIVRPGTVYEVAYDAATGQTTVKTNKAGLSGMLNRLHHINGFWHEYALINVWAGALLFTSLALMALALSGIYLWFRIYQERVAGTVLLALSLGYGLGLIVLMRNAV